MRYLIVAMALFSSFFSALAQNEKYSDPDFSFVYPKGFTKLSSSTPDRLDFRNGSGTTELTVSILQYNPSVSGQGLRDAFDRILQHRMDAQRMGMIASDVLEHSAVETIPGGYQAHFQGLAIKDSRRFFGLLLMARGCVLVFYLEGLNVPEAELKAQANVVFSNIQLR